MANKPIAEKIKGIFNWQDITMTANYEHKWEDITLKSLKARLHSLPKAQATETLRAKLFAAISYGKLGAGSEQHPKGRLRGWGIAAAAAAVLLIALVLLPNYRPSVTSRSFISDLNDKANRSILADQNSALFEDSNYASRGSTQ